MTSRKRVSLVDKEIQAAAALYEKRNPKRKDLRGCGECKKKLAKAMKPMPCPERPRKLFVCPRCKLIVSPRICKMCKRDKSFARLFFSEYVSNRAARDKPCKWASGQAGVEQVKCCDGEHTTDIRAYDCDLHKKVFDPDCHVCKDYQPKEA